MKESKTALLVQPYGETARQKHEKIDCLAKNEIAGKSGFNPAISFLAAASTTQAVWRSVRSLKSFFANWGQSFYLRVSLLVINTSFERT